MLLPNTSIADIEIPLSRAERRERGIFYSPDDIAQAMIRWAIRDATDTVFDPSFGGCAFLRAASQRLRLLGAPTPNRHVYGVDWDERTWRDARQLIDAGADSAQFRAGDFLTIYPTDLGAVFTAVVGNPPYVRRRMLDSETYAAARSAMSGGGYRLSGQASYWAYFVLHALQFIAPGGRLALILPGSLLHTDYGRTVRGALRDAFTRVTVVAMDGSIFHGAQEESLLVLAEQYGGTNAEVRVGTASRRHIDLTPDTLTLNTRVLAQDEVGGSWLRGMVKRRVLDLYDELASHSTRLGDEARIRIGVVTGANRFFVLTDRQATEREIETECLHPVVTHSAQLQGLTFTREDFEAIVRDDGRAFLFRPPAGSLPPFWGPCLHLTR